MMKGISDMCARKSIGTTKRSRKRGTGSRNGGNINTTNSNGGGSSGSGSGKMAKCAHCGKLGHTKDQCHKLHPELKPKKMSKA